MASIVHWVETNGVNYELVDDFKYDTHGHPIVPNNDFAWVDIHGIQHHMRPRDTLPPLVFLENGITNYYW